MIRVYGTNCTNPNLRIVEGILSSELSIRRSSSTVSFSVPKDIIFEHDTQYELCYIDNKFFKVLYVVNERIIGFYEFDLEHNTERSAQHN